MSSASKPPASEFEFLKSSRRQSAGVPQLIQAFGLARSGALAYAIDAFYGQAYTTLLRDLIFELGHRSDEARAFLSSQLGSFPADGSWLHLARVVWRWDPEAVEASLEAALDEPGSAGEQARTIAEMGELFGGLGPIFEQEGHLPGTNLALVMALFPEAASGPTGPLSRLLAIDAPEGRALYRHWEERIMSLQLAHLQEALEHIALPAIVISYLERDTYPLGGCRFGGDPDVPAGFGWPGNANGPLAFIGQLRLSELLPVPQVPREGMLYFFYDAQHQPANGEAGPGAWRALFHGTEAELTRLAAPAGSVQPAFEPREATFTYALTLPERGDEAWSLLLEDEDELEDELEAVEQLAEELREITLLSGTSQLFGYAWFEQDHNPNAQGGEGEAARLLLQVGSDDDDTGMLWGSSGQLYFWLGEADWAEFRLQGVWGQLESYLPL